MAKKAEKIAAGRCNWATTLFELSFPEFDSTKIKILIAAETIFGGKSGNNIRTNRIEIS